MATEGYMPKSGMDMTEGTDEAITTSPRSTPLAKAMAADLGIDLSGVAGSGYLGKITSADLAGAVSKIKESIERGKLSETRKAIARRMSADLTQIPAVTQNIKIDVTRLMAMCDKINLGKENADKVSLNDIIVKAVGKVVSEQERFRMTLHDGEVVLHNRVNVGVALGLDESLPVPVIRDVDKKGLSKISEEIKSLAKKAREGKLMPDETGDSCITVLNIGMFGIYSFTPIINQPEASIVGICAIEDEPVLTEGQMVARKKMMVCMTFDYRILNDTEVCKFESRLKELLENPVSIFV